MYSAENAGLIKFDFLGLKTLTVINNTQNLIRKRGADLLSVTNVTLNVTQIITSSNDTFQQFMQERSPSNAAYAMLSL